MTGFLQLSMAPAPYRMMLGESLSQRRAALCLVAEVVCYNSAAMAISTKMLQFKVLIEQDEDGLYVASVPELPGCYTQGKTLEQVRERIKEAILLVLESDRKVREEKIKSPASQLRFFGIEDIHIRYA